MHMKGDGGMEMLEANKELVARYYDEILTKRNLTAFAEIFAPDFQCYTTEGPAVNLEQYKQAVNLTHLAFPDLQIAIADQIAAGDKVVTRWTGTGTHQGNFLGFPPTGKQFTISAIHIHQISSGRIVGLWEAINLHLILFQLGVLPH